MEREILPHLDNFIGQVFDKICSEILRYLRGIGRINLDYDRAGRWWDSNEEIDLVGMAGDIPVFVAEWKWSKKAIGIDVLKNLQRKVPRLAPEGRTSSIRLGLFSRSGFTKELEVLGKRGKIELIDIRKIGL